MSNGLFDEHKKSTHGIVHPYTIGKWCENVTNSVFLEIKYDIKSVTIHFGIHF